MSKAVYPMLYIKFDNGKVFSTTKLNKRSLSAITRNLMEYAEEFRGYGKVTYGPDMYNEFDFHDINHFLRQVYGSTEKELLRDFIK